MLVSRALLQRMSGSQRASITAREPEYSTQRDRIFPAKGTTFRSVVIPGLRRAAARRASSALFASLATARPVEGTGRVSKEERTRRGGAGAGGADSAGERHLLESSP